MLSHESIHAINDHEDKFHNKYKDFKADLEDKIIRAFAASHKSQRQLGKELGTSASAVNQFLHREKYPKRRYPTLEALLHWADVTGHTLVIDFKKHE